DAKTQEAAEPPCHSTSEQIIQGGEYGGDYCGQRGVAGGERNNNPGCDNRQGQQWLESKQDTERCRNAFASAELQEYRIKVAQENGDSCQSCRVGRQMPFVRENDCQPYGKPAFRSIAKQSESSGSPISGSQYIGRTRVP